MILAVKNIVLILELGKSLIWITTHKIITHNIHPSELYF